MAGAQRARRPSFERGPEVRGGGALELGHDAAQVVPPEVAVGPADGSAQAGPVQLVEAV